MSYTKHFDLKTKFPYNERSDWLKQRTLSENKEKVNDIKLASKFPYNERSDWLKQRTLSENKEKVNDIKLASKFLLRNFDKFDPN